MGLSGLSEYEYAAIIGHYNGLNKEPKKLETRGYSKELLAHVKKQKKTILESLNFRFSETGIKYDNFNFIMTTYSAFKQCGVLPFQGCFTEQPSKIIEIFNLLDALVDEAQQKAAKEQERLNKQNGRNRR